MIDKITVKIQAVVHNEASIFQYCLPASSICFASLCFALSDLSRVLLHNVAWAQNNNMMQKHRRNVKLCAHSARMLERERDRQTDRRTDLPLHRPNVT